MALYIIYNPVFVITMPHITSIGKAKKEHQYVSPVRQKSTN